MHNNKSQLKTDGQEIITPAQVVIKNTPVGSGRLLLNCPEFWPAFSLDQNSVDLIWNERTRQEWRGALQAEVQKLDVEKERTEDIIPRVNIIYACYSRVGEVIKVSLRDPFAFFQALYHRFLCDADTGLTIDGAVPDEIGASDDWNDFDMRRGIGYDCCTTTGSARARLVLRRNTRTWENVTGYAIIEVLFFGMRRD
ncbi:hypothetical protein Tco_1302588 [Tanacetum coccineum]